MTPTPLPNAWSWHDQSGRSHMVSEGALLEASGQRRPQLRTLCGEPVPVGVHRFQLTADHCDGCHTALTTMIGAAFDGLG